MGVNVSLYRNDREEHSTWDWGRYAGDREIARVLSDVGYDQKQIGHPMDCEFQMRPKDVDAFRDVMIAECPENEDRWRELAEILKDEDWWINIGY